MNIFYKRLKFKHIFSTWQACWALPCPLCDGSRTAEPRLASHTDALSTLCADCVAMLPWYAQPHCPQCALPTTRGEVCGRCLQHPFAFDHTITRFRYAFPLDRLLHQFKYHQQLAWGAVLSASLLPLRADCTWAGGHSVLLAMPMHRHRLQQRGFNHALALAEPLATAWQMPLLREACIRRLDTPSQAGLDMKTRLRNLRQAFAMQQSLHGMHVVLVDDVMTTGASLHALAQACKQAGAARVTALVLARTLK